MALIASSASSMPLELLYNNSNNIANISAFCYNIYCIRTGGIF
jgi:hypothetical protein